VDAVLCSLQKSSQESQTSRSRSLRVWLGVVATVAIVIEYYVPRKFQEQRGKWMTPDQRVGIIPFPVLEKKSVLGRFRLAWPRVSSVFHIVPRSMRLLCSSVFRRPLCIRTIPNSQGRPKVSLRVSG
jgi:hypothetical protein